MCQEQVCKYPYRFSFYSNCNTFVNPAHAACHSRGEIALGNKRMFGTISNISATYFFVNIRIQPENKDKPFSTAGILLYNDSEGKYLNRTRFYACYSWHGNLSHTVKFSAGLFLGGMNYSVKGTALSGNGSDTKMDGSVGINVYNRSFYTGIAVGQVFNSKVQPLEEVTILSPFVNIVASKTFLPGRVYSLKTSIHSTLLLPSGDIDSVKTKNDVNLEFIVKNNFLVSAGIHDNTLMTIGAGFNNLQLTKGQLGIMISYIFPVFHTSAMKRNYGEIGVNYLF